ncbi:hypothetical protein F5J12DRAFT_896704 [Pisolithus orientalis]|uniref:uncharacterized protein n=1 Tax=Pisolithus orientalis TaxID=936130 RepID=UPI002225756D|nr:uncharacterized protein F5J12DRAFT_896704 [Pisolithus orientalis]KAI5994595.1 hypothetical protein F5J12DRAFT_896704 [Pisolithus orientalis]
MSIFCFTAFCLYPYFPENTLHIKVMQLTGISAHDLDHLEDDSLPDPTLAGIPLDESDEQHTFLCIFFFLFFPHRDNLWEEKGKVFPINMRIDVADGPVIVEAYEAYEWWVSEEIAWHKTNKDMQMGEEAAQEVGGQETSAIMLAAMEKMLHVKVVSQPVWKTVTESEDEDKPKIIVLPSLILHKVPCMQCMGCEKSTKAAGKKVQAGTSVVWSSKAARAGPSKRAADNDDNNKVEVVESHAHVKGKAPVQGGLNSKVAADLLQLLRLLHVEATELHAA